jgi:hypothetical protein
MENLCQLFIISISQTAKANKREACTLSSLQFSSSALRLSSIHNTMYKWNNSFASTPALIVLGIN